ncbi:MAG: hypothetical protein RLZZ175_2441 [Bacteroidota bacterium]|jgi:hypothetical protein
MNKFCLFLLLILITNGAFAQNVKFDNPSLKTILISQGLDKNKDGEIQISEVEKVDTLDLEDKLVEINSFNEIVHFKNLTYLNLKSSKIEKLDLSQNTKLVTFLGTYGQFNELILSNNPNLESIYLDGNYENNGNYNRVENIPFDKLPKLKIFKGLQCPLVNVDLSQNIELQEITFVASKLKTVILPTNNNSKLEKIDIRGVFNIYDKYSAGFFGQLDFSNCLKLKKVAITSVGIKGINLINCTNLEVVDLMTNSINELILPDNSNINFLRLDNNPITKLTIGNSPMLKEVTCVGRGNMVTNLDISKAVNLGEFNFGGSITNLTCIKNQINKIKKNPNQWKIAQNWVITIVK